MKVLYEECKECTMAIATSCVCARWSCDAMLTLQRTNDYTACMHSIIILTLLAVLFHPPSIVEYGRVCFDSQFKLD